MVQEKKQLKKIKIDSLQELENYLVKKGLDKQEINELIGLQATEAKETFSNLTGDALDSRILKAVIGYFRKFLKTPADLVDAIVLLDGGVLVRNRTRIQNIIQQAKEDPIKKEELLGTGELMEMSGKLYACDMRETYNSGDTNPNYKKPLVESRFRILRGRFVDTDEKVKNFELSLNSNDVTKEIPSRKGIKFYAVKRGQTDDGTSRLTIKTGTKVMEGAVEWDVDKEIDDAFGDRELPPERFDDAIKAVADSKENNLFLIKGEVTEMNLEAAKPNIRIQNEGGMEDETIEIFVKIPSNLLASADLIAPYSMGTVIGQIWKMPARDEASEPLRGMTAMAIWSDEQAVIGKKVTTQNMTPEEGDDVKGDDVKGEEEFS